MNPPRTPTALELRQQEIAYDHPHSHFHFRRPFVATAAALDTFGLETLLTCLAELRELAKEKRGIDYLQVFDNRLNPEAIALWFIEDAVYVTALLPSDY